MDLVAKMTGWIRQLTEVGLALIMLGVVVQVIFGTNVAFFPLDILGNVLGFVKSLGGEGLVGLVALWVLWAIYNNKGS